jgi:protein-S-isoprenylcysteine O-methyltransferase Ste14
MSKSKEVIAILQNSLAENERIKRAQFAAFAALFLITLVLLLWIGHLSSNPSTDLREPILWSVIAMVVIITYGVIALAIYINRTTAGLLRTLKSVSEKS